MKSPTSLPTITLMAYTAFDLTKSEDFERDLAAAIAGASRTGDAIVVTTRDEQQIALEAIARLKGRDGKSIIVARRTEEYAVFAPVMLAGGLWHNQVALMLGLMADDKTHAVMTVENGAYSTSHATFRPVEDVGEDGEAGPKRQLINIADEEAPTHLAILEAIRTARHSDIILTAGTRHASRTIEVARALGRNGLVVAFRTEASGRHAAFWPPRSPVSTALVLGEIAGRTSAENALLLQTEAGEHFVEPLGNCTLGLEVNEDEIQPLEHYREAVASSLRAQRLLPFEITPGDLPDGLLEVCFERGDLVAVAASDAAQHIWAACLGGEAFANSTNAVELLALVNLVRLSGRAEARAVFQEAGTGSQGLQLAFALTAAEKLDLGNVVLLLREETERADLDELLRLAQEINPRVSVGTLEAENALDTHTYLNQVLLATDEGFTKLLREGEPGPNQFDLIIATEGHTFQPRIVEHELRMHFGEARLFLFWTSMPPADEVLETAGERYGLITLFDTEHISSRARAPKPAADVVITVASYRCSSADPVRRHTPQLLPALEALLGLAARRERESDSRPGSPVSFVVRQAGRTAQDLLDPAVGRVGSEAFDWLALAPAPQRVLQVAFAAAANEAFGWTTLVVLPLDEESHLQKMGDLAREINASVTVSVLDEDPLKLGFTHTRGSIVITTVAQLPRALGYGYFDARSFDLVIVADESCDPEETLATYTGLFPESHALYVWAGHTPVRGRLLRARGDVNVFAAGELAAQSPPDRGGVEKSAPGPRDYATDIGDNERPFFRHDCSRCTFLGCYRDGETRFDLYFCTRPTSSYSVSVVSRSGEGPGGSDQGSYFHHLNATSELGSTRALIRAAHLARRAGIAPVLYDNDLKHDGAGRGLPDTRRYTSDDANENFPYMPHDCPSCQFLGCYFAGGQGQRYDLYRCTSDGLTVVAARHGRGDAALITRDIRHVENFSSFVTDYALRRAAELARARGLDSGDCEHPYKAFPPLPEMKVATISEITGSAGGDGEGGAEPGMYVIVPAHFPSECKVMLVTAGYYARAANELYEETFYVMPAPTVSEANRLYEEEAGASEQFADSVIGSRRQIKGGGQDRNG